MRFEIEHSDARSSARAGVLHTPHGEVHTPIFMPVGTVGTVKAVHAHELREDIKADIILGNTYHLYLRPGTEIIKGAGGIQKFNSWNGPMLTDSGGFQVFSLAHRRKITEEGAEFQSHIDGSRHLFTPERVMDIQREIGADIIMAFDECPPGDCNRQYARTSLDLTMRWLKRCQNRLAETEPLYGYPQSLFPIVQGAGFADLRREAAERVAELGADGNAIGGLSVGEPTEVMYEMIEVVNEVLPKDKPRYLMGVGTPANILEGIERGVDMFDCIMPTRNGRNGQLFTWQGTMNMRNEKWKDDHTPLDPEGTSFVDHAYTKAYLRHLIRSEEILGLQIASIHNLAFYLELVRQARQHIIAGDYTEWKAGVLPQLQQRR
ncbi:Queuine tRNA-ribosyltransferase [Porphyromonas levii]|uniref:tRNA guanosine(34) transglycosylase Tgt n=1 Tax=Porphyromonas levii TaxID=28114 RepID=UPI001B8D158E|nr:tRNA guanosine(34) transglycosylase Tgt [Porphyromonas levii]MBR8730056.1 Queuine tRNA-ribosyltransferase [Porphyromonas levii]MBR8763395.1 Queuine tRNA-ribosyltransferase [Porphyromonas levii]